MGAQRRGSSACAWVFTGRQIAGVTAIVGVAVVALSGRYVTRLAQVVLHESHATASSYRGHLPRARAGERPGGTVDIALALMKQRYMLWFCIDKANRRSALFALAL